MERRGNGIALSAIGATAAAFLLWRYTSKKQKLSRTGGSPEEWLAELKQELYGSVMPFWVRHSVDAEKGGFHSCLARDGSLYDADKKYTWLNGRAVWMWSELVRLVSDEELQARSNGTVTAAGLLEASRRGADFLIQHAICRQAVREDTSLPRPNTPTRRSNTPTRRRNRQSRQQQQQGDGGDEAHVRVVAALSSPVRQSQQAKESPGASNSHAKVVAALSSPMWMAKSSFKEAEIDHVWSCLSTTGEPLHLERKPFSAMFVCQGIANLARVLRDQEASSASSSSSSSPSSSLSSSSPSSLPSSESWRYYAAHAQQLLDTVLRWAHDPTPLGRPSCGKYKAWNVPMIALSVLDTFLSEGGLLSSSEGGDDDGVDGAVRERYEAEARWCVDELLAHMVDEKRVAVENIAPVKKKGWGGGDDKAAGAAAAEALQGQQFGYDPESWEGRTVIPGHGIECAWFLMDYCSKRLAATSSSSTKKSADEMKRLEGIFDRAVTLLDWSFEAGWDNEWRYGGGLRYFVDSEEVGGGGSGGGSSGGGVAASLSSMIGGGGGAGSNVPMLEKDMKLWWPHSEAMVAFAMAYEKTGDARHWARFKLAAAYSLNHFSDAPWRRDGGRGEWFGYLDRRGEVTHSFKGGPYKCAFHTPRALLMCTKILERIVAAKE